MSDTQEIRDESHLDDDELRKEVNDWVASFTGFVMRHREGTAREELKRAKKQLQLALSGIQHSIDEEDRVFTHLGHAGVPDVPGGSPMSNTPRLQPDDRAKKTASDLPKRPFRPDSSSGGTGLATRLSLEITPELDETLDRMAEKMEETKGGVLLRAIALLKTALDAQHEGKRIAILDDSENSEQEIEF
jgi:hypothetical protein